MNDFFNYFPHQQPRLVAEGGSQSSLSLLCCHTDEMLSIEVSCLYDSLVSLHFLCFALESN